MKVFNRTNKGIQCSCGAMLILVKKWEYYIASVCPSCYHSVYCNFDSDKNSLFENTGCEQVVMIDKN